MVGVNERLQECLGKFRDGTLTELDLQRALASVDDAADGAPCQRLLYLQAANTSVTKAVIEGMSIVDGAGAHDGAEDPDDWPYKTVHEAMMDGWRIVKFPEMALMMAGEEQTWGLGFEFILEK